MALGLALALVLSLNRPAPLDDAAADDDAPCGINFASFFFATFLSMLKFARRRRRRRIINATKPKCLVTKRKPPKKYIDWS